MASLDRDVVGRNSEASVVPDPRDHENVERYGHGVGMHTKRSERASEIVVAVRMRAVVVPVVTDDSRSRPLPRPAPRRQMSRGPKAGRPALGGTDSAGGDWGIGRLWRGWIGGLRWCRRRVGCRRIGGRWGSRRGLRRWRCVRCSRGRRRCNCCLDRYGGRRRCSGCRDGWRSRSRWSSGCRGSCRGGGGHGRSWRRGLATSACTQAENAGDQQHGARTSRGNGHWKVLFVVIARVGATTPK